METDFSRPSERFRPDKADIEAWNGRIDEMAESEDLESVMRSLASIVNEYDDHNMDRLQCGIYHKALDWLQTLKTQVDGLRGKLGAVRAIQYTSRMANSDGEPVSGTERIMYLFYNRNTISDKDAETVLDRGDPELDPRVVVMWPSQAAALFPDLCEAKEEDDERQDET